MWEFLHGLLRKLAGVPAQTTTRLADLRPGRVAVEGLLRTLEPIPAPLGGTLCAGYTYTCTHQVNSRLKGFIRRKLREVLVYAPELSIELEGGPVPLRPDRSDLWSSGHHGALLAEDYQGFEAKERLLALGARVRIIGKVRADAAGALALHFSELYLLDETPARPKPQRTPQRRGFRQRGFGRR
jgi:hypothetical protein